MNTPFLSVIVPAYNEETRLHESLLQISRYLHGRELDFEIIVVDDGSRDQTARIGADYRNQRRKDSLQLISYPVNRGKGYAVRRGMEQARGLFALVTDADLSTPMEELPKLETEVIHGACDLAFGSRDVAGSRILVRQSWIRENAGRVFNRIVQILMGMSYKDTQCGFKLFQMSSCRDIFKKQRVDRFAFDVEVLFIAEKWGLVLSEKPVVWSHAEGSKVRLFPDAIWTAFDLMKIRFHSLLGHYDRPRRKG